jgi:hypothetical protein
VSLTRAVPLLLLTAASCHLVFPYSPADHNDARLTDASHDVFGPFRDTTTIDADSRPGHRWSKGFSGEVQTMALVADSAGNTYLGGWFNGIVDFGGGNRSATQSTIFVASFDANHQHRWSTAVAPGQLVALAYDNTNKKLMLAGDLKQTTTIGSTTLTRIGSSDLLLVAFETDGSVAWASNYGAPAATSGAVGVAVQDSMIYVTGSCSGSLVVVQPSTCVATDAFLATFNAKNGTPSSLQVLGGVGVDNGTGVAADANNVYLVGVFSAHFTLGSTTISVSSADVILVAFKPGANPKYQWHRQLGGPKAEQPGGVTVDPAGNVYVCGGFQGTGSFPDTPLTSKALHDAFIASFASDGKARWARRFGGKGSDLARAMATDAKGNLYVTGYVDGLGDFGSTTYPTVGMTDAFVANFSGAGDYRWIQLYGSASNDTGVALAVSGSTLYATGTYQGDLDLGDGSLLKLNGTTNTFVVQIGSP